MTTYPFQDASLSPRERARDLLARLTLQEKAAMITSRQDAIPRLGIPATHFGVEIARGLVQRDNQRETTILPQPWGMAAMFDDDLMEKLGSMAGTEVRISNQMSERPSSLALFGPTVDMERDPRWGRNEEAYGEDPCLTGRMTAAYTRGLRGKDPTYIQTAPLLKHFFANNYEGERLTTNANVTPRLKREYYLKAFEPAIRKGGAVGLMTAYNRINGIEGVNNPDVSQICKKEWGMTFAVSDGGDFGQNVSHRRTYPDHAHAIADILGVGADVMLDPRDMVDPAVQEALGKGYLQEERLDRAVEDILTLRFMLGDFDPDNPYAHVDPALLACTDHKSLAVQAAKESMILLENKGLLPLQDDGQCTVAVLGPLSNENYTCWYCGYAEHQTPVVQGLREYLGESRVHFDECLDRVVLKSLQTDKYVRLLPGGGLIADGSVEQAEVFERNDWDFGSVTLRSLRTGKYVTEGAGAGNAELSQEEKPTDPFDLGMNCVSEKAFGWFVMEMLKAQDRGAGIFSFDTWQDRQVAVDSNGRVVSAARPGDSTDRLFAVEIVSSGAQRAQRLAAAADYAVVCGGNHPLINAREEYDRPDLRLPQSQTALLEAAVGANANTVLYLITGYPFAIQKERELAAAVLCSSHLGPCLGTVAAKTLFGENNPAGRTPTTWYRSVRDLPAISDYDIQKNKITYLYFDGAPLYPFGYGLSYTAFAYGEPRTDRTDYGPEDPITVQVPVTNTGHLAGEEVVQLYVAGPQSVFTRPKKALKAFARVHLLPGETRTVRLTFEAADLAIWLTGAERYAVEKGVYTLLIGASSSDIRCQAEITLAGEVVSGRDGTIPVDPLDMVDYARVEFLTDKTDMQHYLEAEDWRSWCVYESLDLTGCNAFEVRLASPAAAVEMTLWDRDTGALLGTVHAPGTGSLTQFALAGCEIQPREGLVNLRIGFAQQTCFKAFRFYKK